jgi:sulfur relay (sulfurtransferase) complex TusBCD TusD component (DsrE family)
MYLSIRSARGLLAACVLLFLVACGAPPAAEEPINGTPTTEQPTAAEAAPATEELPAAAEETPPAEADEAAPEPTTSAELAAQGGGLVVNITTDDTWSATMALSLATTAREQGVEPVIVFLNVRGVYLADSERLPATEGNSDLNIHERLQAFVEAGGQVVACPSCSREAGLTQEDYIEGVTLGEPGGIIPTLTDPTITVVSYTGRSGRE